MVWHWFRKPAGEILYRFESCTLRIVDFVFSYIIVNMGIEKNLNPNNGFQQQPSFDLNSPHS